MASLFFSPSALAPSSISFLFSIAFSGIVRIISTIFLTVKWSVFGAEWAVLVFYAVGAVLTFFILLIKRYIINIIGKMAEKGLFRQLFNIHFFTSPFLYSV